MLVLDTNVLSEVLRAEPDPAVLKWMAAQPRDTLHTTALTQAEMLEGVARLPPGRRRPRLMEAIARLLLVELAGRILPFDGDAAVSFAGIASRRRTLGRPIGSVDGFIAGICQSRGAALATRDLGDFADCGVALIDPWRV